jgi:hypothetical protein
MSTLHVVAIIKVLLFNFIFKNNTSTQGNEAHQKIHLLCVAILGLFTLLSSILDQTISFDGPMLPRWSHYLCRGIRERLFPLSPWLRLLWKGFKCAILGAIFQMEEASSAHQQRVAVLEEANRALTEANLELRVRMARMEGVENK